MNKIYALVLLLATLGAAALAMVPWMILRPFEAQTEGGVGLAYTLRQWSPLATGVLLLAGFVLLAALWKKSTWRLRAPAILAVGALVFAAYLARKNLTQDWFEPMGVVGFVGVAEAEHLVPEEMVMGVVAGGQAKAYPVGMIAYHHVLNDEVGGVPVAVTY